jgi:hypothetical protein
MVIIILITEEIALCIIILCITYNQADNTDETKLERQKCLIYVYRKAI